MRLRTALLLPVCGLAAAQDWTTFYSAYQDGLRAQARGEAPEAVRAFTRAAALAPVPGTRVRTYGLNFLPAYHPYLRLAEAALAAGDLDGAERALDTSARYGKEPAAAREALRAKVQEARRPQPEPVGVAERPAAPVPAAAPPPPPAPRQEPAPEPAPIPPPPAPRIPPRPAPPEVAPPVQAPAPPAPPPEPARPRRWPWWALAGAGALLALAAARPRRRRAAAPTLKVNPHRPGDLTADAATVLPVHTDPNLGRRFGPWEARAVLGVGGCATAYLAVHAATGQEAALKLPHRNLVADADFLARFRREAALGALLDHPRIVAILDPGPEEGMPWLAMRFVRGETLEARLSRQPPLTVAEASTLAAQVAEALAYAHGLGVVHRDLKPANLMLGDQGAVVMDFGIARILDGTMTATALFMGTPAYCAPECILTPRVGPAADRYALGIILFEMLAGRPPFKGDTHFQILEAQRSEPLPSLAALRPDLPAPLVRLVERLCAKAPGDRPEDGEILRLLAEAGS